ncbi:MAG: CotH kinase family protein, partial [Deltaproteobacteria bacterium]|nr:CotH kinase family protein [Deltaproteobacteria bacterium]
NYAVAVLSPGQGGTWDGVAWSRTTTLADAGPVEVLFAVKPVGMGGMPETVRASVWVVDDWTSPGNEPVDPQTYTREFGLPVMHILPDLPVSQSYGDATTWLDGVEYTSTVKIRGASSSDFPKNHFTMEFEPTQVDLGDYGLGRKDHLVLISTFDDNAYVRQKLVYDAWMEMAAFRGTTPLTPRTAFIVVYLQGVYHGLYIAIDHIDDEFVGELGYDPDANLYKSVSHDANFWLTRNNGSPKSDLTSGWEKKEGPDEDWSDLEGLTQWAGSIDPATFAAQKDDWIETSEFIDWLLLVHHFAANDSAGKNAYIYNAPLDQRFHYVPWDFNHALGQDWRTLRVSADTHTHFENRNAIFSHLVNEPGLATEVWAHYDALRAPGAPLAADRLLSLTDGYYELIHPSAQRDWLRWAEEYATFGRWASQRQGDLLDYPGERAYMEQWILDREAAMTSLHPVASP